MQRLQKLSALLTLGLSASWLGGCLDSNDPPSSRSAPFTYSTPKLMLEKPFREGVQDLFIADFNNDGLVDIVQIERTLYMEPDAEHVYVFTRQSDGLFSEAVALPVGTGPADVAIADLNNDGALDIVVANFTSDDISVLLGNGDATFAAQQRFPVNFLPAAVEVADLNGDGILDIAAVGFEFGVVSILAGTGAGDFIEEQRLTGSGENTFDIVVDDFNQDGLLDVITAGDLLTIHLGTQDGPFESRNIPFTSSVSKLAVTELTGDAAPDLVVDVIGVPEVWTLLNDGFGQFQASLAASHKEGLSLAAVFDFNFDGLSDLLLLSGRNGFGKVLSIALGDGNGTFTERHTAVVSGGAGAPAAITDINRDGTLDILLPMRFSGIFTFHDNAVLAIVREVDGSFPKAQFLDTGNSPWDLLARDFNRDALPDLLVTHTADDNLVLFIGAGDGTFEAGVRLETGQSPGDTLAADFNSDGFLDIVTANSASDDLSLFLGNGDATFQPERRIPVIEGPGGLAVGDVDGDGNLDLIISTILEQSISIRFGNGDGTFVVRAQLSVGTDIQNLAVGDLDGNGTLDIATIPSDGSDDAIMLFFGGGDGTFDDPRRVEVGTDIMWINAHDLDGDGAAEILVTKEGELDFTFSGVLVVLSVETDGAIVQTGRYRLGPGPYITQTLDFDRDGAIDVMCLNLFGEDFSILRGDGRGGFLRELRFGLEAMPGRLTIALGIAAADFDGDGHIDVAAADTLHERIQLLFNQQGE